jgi:hypothetical protein
MSPQLTISPPDVGLALDAFAELAEDLAAAISLGAIDLDFQLAAVVELLITLGPIVLALKAAITAVTALQAVLSTGGIWAYSYTGTGAAFGPAVSSSLSAGLSDGSPGPSSCSGIILAATSPAAWAALQSFFAGAASQAPGLTGTGQLTLEELEVSLSAELSAILLSLQVQLGGYQGQVSGALSVQARLLLSPPSFVGNASVVAKAKASLQGYVKPGSFVLPTVAISAAVNIIEQLTAVVEQLSAQVSACADLAAVLAVPGVLAYTYSGTLEGLGSAIEGSIGGGWPDSTPPGATAHALILLATTPAAQAGLDVFFGGITA